MSLVERRIGLLFAVFLVLLAFAGLRAGYLGTVRASGLKEHARSQQVAELELPAQRGTISDRNGTELAVSEPASDVSANPMLIKDPLGVARRLAPLLRRPEREVLEKLTERDTGFVYLRRKVPDRQARKIAAMEIEGIDLTPSSRRVYPQEWLASQVLGTVGTDGHGLAGIEFSEEKRLHGIDGRRRVVKDALGDPIHLRDERATKRGRDIRLTIDAAIQDKVEEVLAEVGEKYTPKGATAVVMDPRTSEVLALANWPRVDANDLGSAPAYARQNRAIGAAYEPGSTFKAFTVAGALEDGLVTPDTTFSLAPTIQVADRTIEESHGGGGTLTTADILAQSSNVGSVTIGLKMGAERFDQWVRRFGFGEPTGVDLPGEQAGIVPAVEDYSGSTMGNLPLGQGLAVTPLQMAAAYAAIANGGILRAPRLVKEVGGVPVRPPRGERVISSETAASVRSMLEGVLAAGGTASEVEIPGYVLAGKTGTAEKPDPVNGGYSKTKFVASFVGFAPAKKPGLLVAVMVDEPQGETYGGVVAAPAFQRITAFALPYLRIPPG